MNIGMAPVTTKSVAVKFGVSLCLTLQILYCWKSCIKVILGHKVGAWEGFVFTAGEHIECCMELEYHVAATILALGGWIYVYV